MNLKTLGSCCIYLLLTYQFAFAANAENYEHRSESLDSIYRYDENRLRYKQLILPASLIAVGSFGISNGWFHKINKSVRADMSNIRGNHYFRADDYLQYLPVITHIGLGAVNVRCKHSFKERLVVSTTSYLAMSIMVNSIKYTVCEKRPDSNAMNSFPSGHTATVFTGAELVREEYGLGLGIGAYTVATSVAILRLYNDRHWLNDVIAGAGIGILSAHIGYWMLPLYKKLFQCGNHYNVMVFPSYNPNSRNISLGIIALF